MRASSGHPCGSYGDIVSNDTVDQMIDHAFSRGSYNENIGIYACSSYQQLGPDGCFTLMKVAPERQRQSYSVATVSRFHTTQ
jgi:hypothetical protein